MASRSSQIGRGLAKVLGIKLQTNGVDPDPVTRGESVFSVTSADTYVEDEPTTMEWIHEMTPDAQDVRNYLLSLFPFHKWITKYNWQWFIGDLTAGVTIGAVVVPQGMAYAQLATLPVQFGLYTSFMGVLVYWPFATSKDITIGPVAVLSTITGEALDDVARNLPNVSRENIAGGIAIIAGAFVCFLGITRLGFIVELLSLTVISAFLTGSAINIAVGQIPNLMGIKGVNSRGRTYNVVIHVLEHLGRTKLDAALGLTALTMLYLIRFVANYGQRKYPKYRRAFFFAATLRTVFVILLYTMISWLVNRHHRKHPSFKILGHVPRGFQHTGAPEMTPEIISKYAGKLPQIIIVMLIEHIAISKSFGRVNGYKINPSQELVAIGVTNLLGPFVGAYPATGSFSRTAIKSKAGVRTPLAGVITAIVVLLAIYALPAVFFYIPQAALAAVIIHAVLDLITPPNTLYQFWRINPIEVLIFFAGVIVTVFSSIENGVYVTICTSAGLYLYRVLKAKGRLLGKVQVHSVIGDHSFNSGDIANGEFKGADDGYYSVAKPETDADRSARNIYLPLDHHDGSNPHINIVNPYPGIFIYRFSETFNYPNANHYLEDLTDKIQQYCRRTNPVAYARLGDRPWNDPGPSRKPLFVDPNDTRPFLKAVILDFSTVNNVDVTAVQYLIDVRNMLDKFAAPNTVEWHFACINNRWTKRALVSGGFGYPTPNGDGDGNFRRWKPIYSVAEIGGDDSAAADAERREREDELRRERSRGADLEAKGEADRIGSRPTATENTSDEDSLDRHISGSKAYARRPQRGPVAVVHGINRPLFHIDITSALQSAIASAEAKEKLRVREVGGEQVD